MKSALNEGTGDCCIVRATKKYHPGCQQWQEKECRALAGSGFVAEHCKVMGLNLDFGNRGHRLFIL